jgi:hypothetical protein
MTTHPPESTDGWSDIVWLLKYVLGSKTNGLQVHRDAGHARAARAAGRRTAARRGVRHHHPERDRETSRTT